MKQLFVVLIGSFLLVGCRSSYDVTLAGMGGGTKYTGVSKPKFDKATGKYTFKTVDGREYSVSAANVRLIQPHQEVEAPTFNVPQKK
jgi:hypothetical protein